MFKLWEVRAGTGTVALHPPIPDTASGIAFLGTLGWVIWHLGVQLTQMAATGPIHGLPF